MSVNLVTKIETLKRCYAVMQSLCGWLMGLVFWRSRFCLCSLTGMNAMTSSRLIRLQRVNRFRPDK